MMFGCKHEWKVLHITYSHGANIEAELVPRELALACLPQTEVLIACCKCGKTKTYKMLGESVKNDV